MQSANQVSFEVCVETAQGITACAGLADRIELCAGLDVGGLTPSHGLMRFAKDSGLKTHVLIRPRAGDFLFTSEDLSVMLDDIAFVKQLGLHGIVIGAAKDDALDTDIMGAMIDAAHGLDITLHRVFDVVADRSAALELAVDLGIRRILTSGGRPTAVEGAAEIKRLCQQADGRIEIMAGGGITPKNLSEILNGTTCDAIHASCASRVEVAGHLQALGFGKVTRQTDRDTVRQMADAVKYAKRGRTL